MRIDIWSDFVCPFCYIGKRKLEKALKQFKHREEVELVFRSYQLDPTAKRDNDEHLYDVLAKKYGMNREKAKEMSNQITVQAKEEGLDFNFDTSIRTNTADAHRLAHFAYEQGKGLELTERLLKAYFTDSLHIGDHEVLSDLAQEVGMDKVEALNVLKSTKFIDIIKQDQQEGTNIGVQGVPFFVFDHRYAVSGAQPTHVFLEVLEKVKEEKSKLTIIENNTNESAHCTDESCDR
jgi:predicted DsbA family dithiol-disulfide isomerase